jgi:hypothetical protein
MLSTGFQHRAPVRASAKAVPTQKTQRDCSLPLHPSARSIRGISQCLNGDDTGR